jgi:hypothetical protein
VETEEAGEDKPRLTTNSWGVASLHPGALPPAIPPRRERPLPSDLKALKLVQWRRVWHYLKRCVKRVPRARARALAFAPLRSFP